MTAPNHPSSLASGPTFFDQIEDVERLVRLGARILHPPDQVQGEHSFIMADPEGNEFCAFPPED